MGIFTSDNIFGIRIYKFYDDIPSDILYEKKYDVIMNNEQMMEAYLFYNQLDNKNNIEFNIYTECSSTLELSNENTFLMWYPITLDKFLEKFNS